MGLKKEGLDIQVYSFKKPDVSHLTSEMKEEIKYTIYFPSFLVLDIYLSQLYFLYHIPIRYFHTMVKVIFGRYQRFTTFKLRLRSIVNFLRGVHLAFLLKDEKNSIHIHAQFANNTATAGYITNNLLGIPFSFRNHTAYNPPIIRDKVEKAKFVLSISNFDKRQLLSWSDKAYSYKIEVNYLGIKVEEWEIEEEKSKEALIVSVGNLAQKKGFEYLIIAGWILKEKELNFLIKIAGNGTLRNKIVDLIEEKKLGENVEILGYIPNKKVKRLVRESSIFCLPSIITSNGDVDGIPVVLMEAMALAKPVVSTTVSGIPELIDNNINGVLVPQRDAEALANAIERLLKDSKLRKELGDAARKKVESGFNLQKNIKKTASSFRKYIEGIE